MALLIAANLSSAALYAETEHEFNLLAYNLIPTEPGIYWIYETAERNLDSGKIERDSYYVDTVTTTTAEFKGQSCSLIKREIYPPEHLPLHSSPQPSPELIRYYWIYQDADGSYRTQYYLHEFEETIEEDTLFEQLYAYPAAVGEAYDTYHGSTRLQALGQRIQLGNAIYRCATYLSDEIEEWMHYHRKMAIYLSPGLGAMRLETYFPNGDGWKMKSYEQLVDFGHFDEAVDK